jgi:RimJ/RimL family protein N-acetyltransferase
MIETERLILRPWREADRLPFWRTAQDAEVMRFLLPANRKDANAAVDRMMFLQKRRGHCFWAVERQADRRFIGYCGILPPRGPAFEYEIGWRFARDAWGQGYAAEAARASLNWVWENLRTDSVVAFTVPANTRSWTLMERIGMVRDHDGDFDHPDLEDGDPLRRHVLYRIRRPATERAVA